MSKERIQINAEACQNSRSEFAASRGWAALPWSAEKPKRRGWWAVEWPGNLHDIVLIGDHPTREPYVFRIGDDEPLPLSSECLAVVRWAGPLIELESALIVATPPNLI